jgi:hypothetical protein
MRRISPKVLFLILILTGIILRLIQYFLNRSLWFDEAMLALNIADRSPGMLLQPLDYSQSAPVLFLQIEKFFTIIFGISELSLRLFPLLCSVASLFLSYLFAFNLTKDKKIALITLFIVSFNPLLIEYASEVKQYSVDVFVNLLLLTIATDSTYIKTKNRRYLILAVTGGLLIFLSNISIFVIFTISIWYIARMIRDRKADLLFFPVIAIWLIVFGIYFFLFIYHHPLEAMMTTYWQQDFMPLNPFSGEFRAWVFDKIRHVRGMFPDVYLWLFLAGTFWAAWKKRTEILFFAWFPLLLHLGISGLHKYPFFFKFLLYIIPMFAVAMACGIAWITDLVSRYKRFSYVILAGLLVFIPLKLIRSFPSWHEEIKRSIRYIESGYTNGQTVYVYYGSIPAYKFYRKIMDIPFDSHVVYGIASRGNLPNYQTDACKVEGDCWFLFSHDYAPEEEYFVRVLKERGTLLKTYTTVRSSAYLFRLPTCSPRQQEQPGTK